MIACVLYNATAFSASLTRYTLNRPRQCLRPRYTSMIVVTRFRTPPCLPSKLFGDDCTHCGHWIRCKTLMVTLLLHAVSHIRWWATTLNLSEDVANRLQSSPATPQRGTSHQWSQRVTKAAYCDAPARKVNDTYTHLISAICYGPSVKMLNMQGLWR